MNNSLNDKQLKGIRYFELNDLAHPFFYDDFDNMDLAIELAFTDGSFWHIGWDGKEETFLADAGTYLPPKHCTDCLIKDATQQWSKVIGQRIVDFKIDFVIPSLKMTARSIISFENGIEISLILADELNENNELPAILSYSDTSEIYIFFNEVPRPFELLRIELPNYDTGELDPIDQIHWKTNGQRWAGFLIILAVLVATLLYCIVN